MRLSKHLILLKKIILLSSFLGMFPLEYDQKAESFFLQPKIKRFSKFFWCAFTVLINFFACYHSTNEFVLTIRPFIVYAAGFLYNYMEFVSSFSVVVFSMKYGNETKQIYNKLKLLQTQAEDNIIVYIVLVFTIIQVILALLSSFLMNSIENGLIIFILNFARLLYINLLKIITQVRFSLVFIIIGDHFAKINQEVNIKSSKKHIIGLIKQHKNMCDIARSAQKVFSVQILIFLAYNFLIIVCRLLSIYVAVVFERNLLDFVQFYDFFVNISQLLLIVYVPTRCTLQVKNLLTI